MKQKTKRKTTNLKTNKKDNKKNMKSKINTTNQREPRDLKRRSKPKNKKNMRNKIKPKKKPNLTKNKRKMLKKRVLNFLKITLDYKRIPKNSNPLKNPKSWNRTLRSSKIQRRENPWNSKSTQTPIMRWSRRIRKPTWTSRRLKNKKISKNLNYER